MASINSIKPQELRILCKEAAKCKKYAEAENFLRKNLETQFIELALKTLNYYLPSEILKMPKSERKPYINKIPEPHRELVIQGVKTLWGRNV